MGKNSGVGSTRLEEATKHTENDGDMVKFRASLFTKIVSSAVLKVKERKEFDASLKNEIASQHSN